jgi:hypothetical protein
MDSTMSLLVIPASIGRIFNLAIIDGMYYPLRSFKVAINTLIISRKLSAFFTSPY